MKVYHVIGVMSGTSLDGLDMLQVRLWRDELGRWRYNFVKARTLDYPSEWRNRLAGAVNLNGLDLALLHVDYGHFVGQALKEFVAEENAAEKPDFAAVHGHTVFHRPERGLTLQIGDGAAIAAESGIPVICNFRTTDVALGGQGAPLVPIGDALLFGQYDFCLNLGGIANISYAAEDSPDTRIAFDVCPCNMALNRYAAKLGMAYDAGGATARSGRPIPELAAALNSLAYYMRKPPKSLGFEWFESDFMPAVGPFEQCCPIEDILHTLVEHVAGQIAAVCLNAFTAKKKRSMLLTGGGALNTYLAERIAALAEVSLAPTDKRLIDYKEALIFALLGVLRIENRPNCLCSVTGAVQDNIGGAVYSAR